MSVWSSLLLVFAVSVDSLGTGIAYGMRCIRMPVLSLAVIGLCTGGLMTVSMTAGARFTTSLGGDAAARFGGSVLIAIGLWQLYRPWRDRQGDPGAGAHRDVLLQWRIPVLGIAVKILKDPIAADVNRSGTIDGKESLLLGAALGLDAFGAGFGASMAGFSLWVVPIVALCSTLFVHAGTWLGSRAASRGLGSKGWALPGVALIVLGLCHL